MSDASQRFLFDLADIRGDLVQLDSSFKAFLADHDYPPRVSQLLGEFFVASVLLGSTIKFKGRLILQLRSEGKIPLLMVEVSDRLKLRGIARVAEGESEEFPHLFSEIFAGGTLAVTVEPEVGERYQSLVPLVGKDLAECLMHYFQQSEQLNTYLFLTASADSAAGLLLQQLPPQLVSAAEERTNQWQHVKILGETLSAEELSELPALEVIKRLYAGDKVRVLNQESIQFECSCSRSRIANALFSLGEAELTTLFAEQPNVEMHCEFCNHRYTFDRESLTAELKGDRQTH